MKRILRIIADLALLFDIQDLLPIVRAHSMLLDKVLSVQVISSLFKPAASPLPYY